MPGAEYHRAAAYTVSDLFRSISLFDLAIHTPTSAQEAEALDVRKLWYDIRSRIEGFDFTEVRDVGSELVAFTHLLGGYDMAYYSYLW